jgi:hypothetical protein
MPPLAIAAVSAGASLAGGVIGAVERSNASKEAKALMAQRLAEFEKAGMPPETALPLVLQEFKQQGVITPELEQSINVEASKVAQIKEDPRLREAAMQGLQLLQQRSDRGFGAEEEAAFAQARKETGKESQGRLQSILQQMQAKGMGGSGAELAAQLSTSQAGDEQLAAEGQNIAAERARASQDAIQRMFGAATDLRGQDFNVANTKAQAEDQMNRFRIGMEADQQARNIASKNRAQESNLSEKQRIADMNINMANMEEARQNEARMRDWIAKMDLARAKGGIYKEQADQRLDQGKSAAEGWAQVGQGVGGAISGIGAKGIANVPTAAPEAPLPRMTTMLPEDSMGLNDKNQWAEDMKARIWKR